jgi:aminopeptidase N
MSTYRFEPRDPMASYLVTINIGEFEVVEEEGPNGLPIRSYVPPDLGLPAGFSRTADMIAYFSDVFGPYPFETYGVVIVDRFEAALENQTLSVFGRYLATFADAEIVAAHELAHQWFGDSVTPARWEDIWLNEGFATYAEWLWVEHTAGPEAARAQIRGAWGEMRRGGWAPPGEPSPDDLFDGSVYLGGGLVLNALRNEIGDQAFFETLRIYVDRYSYSNATTGDFIAVAEEVAGRDLDELFELWLYSPTVPDLPG